MNYYMNSFLDIKNELNNSQLFCKLEERPTKYMFGTNNYGEILNTFNPADGDAWDVIVPGYPKLEVNTKIKIKKLEGIIEMPNGNHKLIIDIFTDSQRLNKKKIYDEIYTYRRLYNYVCRKRGTVIMFS